jgi:hypothetical protein
MYKRGNNEERELTQIYRNQVQEAKEKSTEQRILFKNNTK